LPIPSTNTALMKPSRCLAARQFYLHLEGFTFHATGPNSDVHPGQWVHVTI
jgi:hypothetical protein